MRVPVAACAALLLCGLLASSRGDREAPPSSGGDAEVLIQTYHQVVSSRLASWQTQGFPTFRSICDKCLEPAAIWRKLLTYRSHTVLIIYLLLCVLTVGCLLFSVAKRCPGAKGGKLQYPEAEAWRQSLARWLWLGWATRWISQWGNSDDLDPTQLADAKELPRNDPDDECAPCSKAFEALWNEELVSMGRQHASLAKVLARFVTARRMIVMALWEVVYESSIYLGPPLAIERLISFVRWVYLQREFGHEVPHSALVEPTLWTIVAFTGLPLAIAVSSTALTMVNARLGIRICGAISSAVFLKGQRLPVGPEDGEPAPGSPRQARNNPFEREGGRDAGRCAWTPLPSAFNLVQLVAQDVNTNVAAFPLAVVKSAVMVPTFVACLTLLCRRLGWAVLFPAGVFFLNCAGVGLVGSLQGYYTMLFCNHAGKRLEFFQQLMFGIRFIKSFGGEGVMQELLERYRSAEVQALNGYYTTMCFMFFMMLQFTRLYFLASLGGYLMIYGSMASVNIIAIVPLLNSVQGAFSAVLTLVPTLASMRPSCMRLERFMKLPEAPRASPPLLAKGAAAEPPWVSIWPAPALRGSRPPLLRVQGSFAWQPDGAPALSALNLAVPHGQLVAVLGQVGAGKSTLLLAILGELHPLEGAHIEVPRKIAYSAQVPHIFEGTLRDNVLQGEVANEERYQEALRATRLPFDLEVLPGGDKVLIGSRGISLSGGQKARVSMARAACCADAEALLVDDPFGAVDFCTAQHLMEHLLEGPILRGRTRIVVCQPDSERLARFDWVVIINDGQVEVQGPPNKVMRTKEYRKLLCSQQQMDSRDGPSTANSGAALVAGVHSALGIATSKAGVREAFMLREEEFQGRTSWATVAYFARMGGWLSILSCIVCYLLKNVMDISADVVLAQWMTHGTKHEAGLANSSGTLPRTFLARFAFWWCLSTLAWFLCWVGGQKWTISSSRGCHAAVVKSLMRAPIDRFYDKTPVGRIMNRMSNDMMHLDTKVFVRICSTIGMAWSVSVPVLYVHLMMPLWFTVLSVPYYYLMVCLLRLYWKTTVPLQYLAQVCKSAVDGELADVESSNASVRAYGKASHRLRVFQLALCDMVSARFLGETVLKRWLNNRIFVLGGIFVTCLSLAVVWVPGAVEDVGTANLILVLVFSIIVTIENMVHCGASAQYQIIAMNRLHEYTALPEEGEEELPTDAAYMSYMVRLPRSQLIKLESQDVMGGIQVFPCGLGQDPLLQQVPCRTAFRAAPGRTLADLAPDCEALLGMTAQHRIVAINGAHRSAVEMAAELCDGDSTEVALHVRSGWLADGVKVEIRNLRAGYSDRPRDVLQDLTLTIPRKCKVGLVGTTGSGKSTLLLCLLRILEPRGGWVLLEGVDTRHLGLRTLRAAIGMVPQDHVLLQGPLRYNIDPFNHYDDDAVWEALRMVQLADYVRGCDGGLNFQVTTEGSNMSYGQRQLMSLARNVLRQPMLLLLDEATSAIDPHTQELVQSTMATAFPDSTMIVVAHRLEAVLGADMVAVLDEGRVAEKGSAEALSSLRGGRFAEMLAASRGGAAAEQVRAEPSAPDAAVPSSGAAAAGAA